VALIAFVLIVNRARGAACNGADRRARAASDNSADGCTAGRANANSGDRSTPTVPSVVTAMVDNGCHSRALRVRVVDSGLNSGPVSLRTQTYR